MSCANTSLPWFIDPPRAMLPRRVAKPKFEIQIETKKINRLCVFHQQLTGAESPNVGTLLIVGVNLALFSFAVNSTWQSAASAHRCEREPDSDNPVSPEVAATALLLPSLRVSTILLKQIEINPNRPCAEFLGASGW